MATSSQLMLVAAYVCTLLALGGAFLWHRAQQQKKADAATAADPAAAARAAAGLNENDDEAQQAAADAAAAQEMAGMTKKQRAKLAKKQQKEAKRHAIEAKEDGKRVKADTRSEERRAKDEAREEKRAAALAAEEAAAAKQKEEEDALFDEWKDLISVETDGSGEADTADESQSLLGEFIAYIKASKVVVLEDLASKFSIRSADVVKRVQSLLAAGMITGVLDDRGKFIYVTEEEMTTVSKFITRRGRVSLAEIVKESNKLIDLASRDISGVGDGDGDASADAGGGDGAGGDGGAGGGDDTVAA